MLMRMTVIKGRRGIATMKVINGQSESSNFFTEFYFQSFSLFGIKMALVGKKLVEQMIKSKALVVISKSYCPFCHKVVLKIIICEQK